MRESVGGCEVTFVTRLVTGWVGDKQVAPRPLRLCVLTQSPSRERVLPVCQSYVLSGRGEERWRAVVFGACVSLRPCLSPRPLGPVFYRVQTRAAPSSPIALEAYYPGVRSASY